jgi:uncharacterized protein (TIGR04255 family)
LPVCATKPWYLGRGETSHEVDRDVRAALEGTGEGTAMPQYVKFDRPPVVEVVCGVRFDAGGKMKVAHIGAFWATLKDAYPVAEEAIPLVRGQFEPDMAPRTWLITGDGTELLQLQKDWFLLNWKKSDDGQVYPSYQTVKTRFDERFGEFLRFLSNERIDISYKEFELTYVNHILKGNGLAQLGEGALFVDHSFSLEGRFLPSPVHFNWQTSYPLPKDYGRLNVTAQTGIVKSTREALVRLDLQAVGLPSDAPESRMDEWFGLAHEWITRGFSDITVPELHEIWGRTL